MLTIRINGQAYPLQEGSTVLQALETAGEQSGALAVQIGGKPYSLDKTLHENCELLPLTFKAEAGRRIYERTLRFILLIAARRLYPCQRVRIEYSVDHGFYVRLPGHDLTAEEVAALETEMHRIVREDPRFRKKVCSV